MIVPPDAYRKFKQQRHGAKSRGIPFTFTFEEWWEFWSEPGRWEKRGNRRGCLCMARRADTGGYEPGNVYIATVEQNGAHVDRSPRRQKLRRLLWDAQMKNSQGLSYMPAENFKAWVEHMRYAHRWTKAECGKRLGCGVNQVQRWEIHGAPTYIGLACMALDYGIGEWTPHVRKTKEQTP